MGVWNAESRFTVSSVRFERREFEELVRDGRAGKERKINRVEIFARKAVRSVSSLVLEFSTLPTIAEPFNSTLFRR